MIFLEKVCGIDGDTIVVGAYGEGSCTDVIDGPDDDGCTRAGAAYVYTRTGTVWTQQARLKAPNSDAGDDFGRAVSVLGDTAVVGALHESGCSDGVDGVLTDNGCNAAGAAYVFKRTGTTWTYDTYLKATNSQAGDWVGRAVAMHDNTIALGAYREDGCGDGFGADPQNDGCANAGAAYVFTEQGGTWISGGYVKATNSDAGDEYGRSIAINANTLVCRGIPRGELFGRGRRHTRR